MAWNTRDLLSRLLFDLAATTGVDLGEIVVVDNASDDGTRDLGESLAAAGVIRFHRNESNRYHGPGLTQGVNLLAALDRPVDLVWALDSDVRVLQPETLSEAAEAMRAAGGVWAAEIDDYRPVAPHVSDAPLALCCALFDPAVVWQPAHRPFLEDGEPARELLADLRAAGHRCVAYPFCSTGSILHLGRGTLREVVRRRDTSNRYHDWAESHHEPHFGLHPAAAELAAAAEARYRSAVPNDTTSELLAVLVAARRGRG